jgi:hypothetical protein
VVGRLGLPARIHPDQTVVSLANAGIPVYELWTFDLITLAEAAIQ